MIGKPRGNKGSYPVRQERYRSCMPSCECGCGQDAGYIAKTDRAQGRIKGEPNRFVPGHQGRMQPKKHVSRPCECGCGETTSPGRRFVSGHNTRSGPEYVAEDCGHATCCWVWQRFKNPAGYGMKRHDGAVRLAHRVYYLERVGPIPDGLSLDHLCRNRACVNPDHLEPVTHRENTLRGEGLAAQHARKTHCKKGHPLSGDNVYLRANGARACRTCKYPKKVAA